MRDCELRERLRRAYQEASIAETEERSSLLRVSRGPEAQKLKQSLAAARKKTQRAVVELLSHTRKHGC